jgi:hypothetical protein
VVASRGIAAAGLLLLLIGPALAVPWTQTHGGPARTEAFEVAPGPWDVVGRLSLAPPDQTVHRILGPALVSVPDGVAGFRHPSSTDVNLFHAWEAERGCTIVRVAASELKVGTTRVDDCRAPGLQGYVWGEGLLLACNPGSIANATLSAYDLDSGETAWAVTAQEVMALALEPVGPAASADQHSWFCSGAAIDEASGEILVPFFASEYADNPAHAVASVALNGTLRWASSFSATDLAGSRALASVGTLPHLSPFSLSATPSGIVAIGLFQCIEVVGGVCSRRGLGVDGTAGSIGGVTGFAMGWMDRSGVPQALLTQHLGTTPGDDAVVDSVSLWAAGGDSLYAALGSRLYRVEPGEPDTYSSLELSPSVVGERLGSRGRLWFGPVLQGDALVLPLDTTITAFDKTTFERRWNWAGLGSDWAVDDVVATTQGELLAIVVQEPPEARGTSEINGLDRAQAVRVVRLDADDGTLLQAIPVEARDVFRDSFLRLYVPPPAGTAAHDMSPRLYLTPLQDGDGAVTNILVVGSNGASAVLGPQEATRQPPVTPETLYPRVNQEFRVRLEARDGVPPVGVYATWGDGTYQEEEWPPDSPTFILPMPMPRRAPWTIPP